MRKASKMHAVMRPQVALCIILIAVLANAAISGEESEEELEQEERQRAEAGPWEVRGEARHWHAAALACSLRGRGGGALAVPRSRRQALAMARLLRAAAPRAHFAFVGLSDLAEEGQFATPEGESVRSVGYMRRHTWDTPGGTRDNCLALDRYGLYWDVPCEWRLPYVCRRPPPPPPPPPTCAPPEGDAPEEEEQTPTQPPPGAFSLERAARSWWGAQAACAGAGLRLAVPRSRFDAAALRDLLSEAAVAAAAAERPPWARAFVGVSDLARAGHLRTVHGDIFDLGEPEQWRTFPEPANDTSDLAATPQPDRTPTSAEEAEAAEEAKEEGLNPAEAPAGGECLTVDRRGLLELARCGDALPAFCAAPPPAQPPPRACPAPAPAPPSADLLPPPPRHFWLEHARGARRPWRGAARACLQGGGLLAVPETTGEAQAMAALLRAVPHAPDASLEDVGAHVWAFVGVWDAHEDGNFSTLLGEELAWARWGVGQPNGAQGGRACLVLDRGAELWDLPCNWTLAFFCRRFPAEPPWTAPAARAAPGQGWRYDSQEMRRWIRNMKTLGVGAALLPPPEDAEATAADGPAPAPARGFGRLDLTAWIESFRDQPALDYAPFDFTSARAPSAVRH